MVENKVAPFFPDIAYKHLFAYYHYACNKASSTTFCCSPAHVSTILLLKMTFLTFPRYSSYSMWVRWVNLQPPNVFQDLVCQT